MSESVIRKAVESSDPELAQAALREIDTLLGSSTDRDERAYLLFSSASCYGTLGDFAEAKRRLRCAFEEKPDESSRITVDFMNGVLSQRQGNYAEAFKQLSSTLSTHFEEFKQPGLRFMYEDIQQRRAFLLVTLSRFDDAITLLVESLSFQLDNESKSNVLAGLGFCHLELQYYELARDYFLQAVALGPTNEWKGKIHFYLGIAYFHTGKLQEAKSEFLLCEQFADANFSMLETYRWLSAICRRLGETSDAERYGGMGKSN